MDPFDDILPGAPAARARPGGKFMPKAKSKQLPRKEISEHATSSRDGKNTHVASSSTGTDSKGISQNECNAVTSTLSTSTEESMRSHHRPEVLPNLEDVTNSEIGNPQQVSVNRDTAALVDYLPSMTGVSEVDSNQNFTNFTESASEADPVGFEVGSVTNFIRETDLNSGTRQPVHSAKAVENVLNNMTALSTTCSTIGRMEEPPNSGEGSVLDSNRSLELIDNSVQANPDKVAIFESNVHSDFNFRREQEVVSAKFELDPFSNVLPDPGTRNAHKFQPKIKPRPRVGNAPAIASASTSVMEKSIGLPTTCTNEVQSFQSSGDGSGGLNQPTSLPLTTSEIVKTTDLSNKFDYMSSSTPFSEDNRSLAAVIPSQSDSLNAMLSEVVVHNGTRDWPSSFGKSAGETADIFSGLESLDDFLTQAAPDTGKPSLHSFNEKGTEENFVIPACTSINSFGIRDTAQVQRCPGPEYHTTPDSLPFNEAAVLNKDDTHTNNRRSETEDVVDLNPVCPVDDVFDYQSMKSGTDPTSEIPVHEELTKSADSPTLADLLHQHVTEEKEDANRRKKNGTMSSSLRKHGGSSITGEEGKGDELQENGDDYEVDYSSKKKRASTSSKKKSAAKNGKTSQKRKKADDDLEKTTKEPPKKFSHSTRRKKRCVDKALLEIPEDELDPRTLPIKDIILLAEYRERLAKKEATTSKTSSTNQSGGGFLHEADANDEEEIFGSEDGRDPGDGEASEEIPLAPSLFNYQSFMDKAPRGKWSKQDTELFYEAVREFGTDFSMIQQLFPGRTRHQIKLKYKKEERQHPLQLSDALNNRPKDHPHFKLVIEQLQQASTKAEQDPGKDASDFMTGEEVEEPIPETNEEVAPTKQDTDVKDQEGPVELHSPEQSEDSDDDFQRWSQYKSDY
ncbi:SANT/Myb domain [Sesbania bispinosa]|nr:SANT/Myb domain [Sesbania bispinosa]